MILLASGSPRRHQLLRQHKVEFRVIKNLLEIEPPLSIDMPIIPQVIELATAKAKASAKGHADWVLSADTVVVLGSDILGKPANTEEAVDTVMKLQGTTHQVITGFCLYHPIQQVVLSHADETTVTFNSISRLDVRAYVETFRPLDKAGSYGLQEVPDSFVKKVHGDIETVIGLRVKSVVKLLADYGIV